MEGQQGSGRDLVPRGQGTASVLWRTALLACLLPLSATAVLAQSPIPGTFTAPPGCTGFLTVQSRGCTVSNHYRCEADAAGDQWSASFDQDGLFRVGRIDRETQWIESFSMAPTVRQSLDPDPADPASFSDLLSTGIDTYDFSQTEAATRTRVRGFDTLTGRSVTIDGVELKETEFDFLEMSEDGTVLRKASGQQFISPEWRLFFSGIEEWDFGDGPVPADGTPKQFVFPGEKGFFSTRPIFDCNVTSSGLQAPSGKDLWHAQF
jgi:hypothetical protein